MADPISLVSSILTIAGAGLTVAQKLYDYSDSISSSGRRCQQVALYVRSTAVAIEEIGKVFREEEEYQGKRELISSNAVETVSEVVGECGKVFERLEAALEGVQDGFERLFFPLRESRLVLLQSNLERLKSTLQCLMQVIIYARLKAGQR
jgi:hypothetical protein